MFFLQVKAPKKKAEATLAVNAATESKEEDFPEIETVSKYTNKAIGEHNTALL